MEKKIAIKVLYISELMTGRDSGAKVSTWLHADIIHSIADCMDVICLYPPKDKKEARENKKFTRFHHTYFIESYKNKWSEAYNILSLNGWCMNRPIRKTILSIIRSNQYDAVFIDDSVLGKLTRQIKQTFPNIHIVSYYHDVKAELSKKWIQQYGLKTIPFNLGLIINERINQKYSDCNLVINEREKRLFQRYYRKKPDQMLPVCVPDQLSLWQNPENEIINHKFQILFVGAYYYPNIAGITWFIQNVLPSLDKNRFHLTIVGSGMEQLKMDLPNTDNITIKGWVEDLSLEYYLADLVIAPLFDGGGMKIKTAEALQYGKCIAGTKECFEGYWPFFSKEIINTYVFQCNTSKEFLSAIKKIASGKPNPKIHSQIRQVYLEYFSIDKNREIIRDALLTKRNETQSC